MKHKATDARTAQPNTAETDALPEVLHSVGVQFEGHFPPYQTVRVMAREPMDAIKRVNAMTTEAVVALTVPA